MQNEANIQSIGVSLLRIHFGIILLAHGWLKVYVFSIAGTVGYFSSIGLPPIIAYLVIFGELVGGLALILGIQTRLAAALAVPIVFGAAVMNGGNGWLHSASGGGWEYAASLTVIAVSLAIMGSGQYLRININPLNRFLPSTIRD
ncbi:MAG: DoxX family protein, partial [Planktomarina sp.]|jgi:putative oxidoreductase|nr:DoxX family protein [Planktomarina sp.]|tara:strand:+ start:36 stop:470 length:435 start_codon:yes stop_codon:yes gene_type:complete